ALLIIIILIAVTPLWFVSRYKTKYPYAGGILTLIGIITVISPFKILSDIKDKNEFYKDASMSKWRYFLNTNIMNYLEGNFEWANGWNLHNRKNINDYGPYPFLRQEDTKDFLGNYMNKTDKVPNLVFLIIEGLGHAYSSPNGYIGNFTPFLYTLKEQ